MTIRNIYFPCTYKTRTNAVDQKNIRIRRTNKANQFKASSVVACHRRMSIVGNVNKYPGTVLYSAYARDNRMNIILSFINRFA